MLTKGGSSVEEMGVDFRGRKGEVDQMAPFSILNPPKEFWEHWSRTGRRQPTRLPGWQGKGKQHSSGDAKQSTFIGSADPTNIFEHFLLVGSLIYLLTFPGWCVLGEGGVDSMALSLLDSK